MARADGLDAHLHLGPDRGLDAGSGENVRGLEIADCGLRIVKILLGWFSLFPIRNPKSEILNSPLPFASPVFQS